MACLPVWFVAHLTILTGIVDGFLLVKAIQPPHGRFDDLLFGCGVTGQVFLSFVATYMAWFRHLAPSQMAERRGKFFASLPKAFGWAAGPLAITMFFMVIGFSSAAAIPYMGRDVPFSMYKLVATLSTIIFFVSLYVRFLFARGAKEVETKACPAPRELEEVVVA